MAQRRSDWDPACYEGSHSFVWKYGAELIGLLAPQPGERILDLGCGTGHLTAMLAAAGAVVLGIDSSPGMIAQARQNFPTLQFQLADAASFHADAPFDAVFSNAALHWMPEAERVAGSMASALTPGGRLVCELGGKGNVAAIDAAIDSDIRNYFPSIAEYSGVLERSGLEVTLAALFDRPTALESGEDGLLDWLAMFRPDNRRPLGEIEAELRPKLFHEGRWVADYRRLRIIARKPLSP